MSVKCGVRCLGSASSPLTVLYSLALRPKLGSMLNPPETAAPEILRGLVERVIDLRDGKLVP